MNADFMPGDKVFWLHISPRGWRLHSWVPATVVKVTARRVTIAAAKRDGTTEQRSVTPEKLRRTPHER